MCLALGLLPFAWAVPSFHELATLIDHHAPELGVYAGYILLHTIYLNHEAIRLNYLYFAVTHNNRVQAWLRRLGDWAMTDPSLASVALTGETVSTITGAIASGFGFSAEHRTLHVPGSNQTLLVPLYRKCELCGDTLKQDRKVQEVWIVTDGGIINGRMAVGRCRKCRTSHFPDRYSTQLPFNNETTTLCSVYNANATHLRIGWNLWADRAVAITMTGLRYSGHMSNETLAQNFNTRHCSSISLSAKQIWKLFVLHEGISKCAQNGFELVIPTYTQIHQVAGLINEAFHPGLVNVIPGSLSHRCSECHHPHRTGFPAELLPGAATNPAVANQIDLVS